LYGSLSAAMARTPAVINTFTGLGFLFSDDRRARGLRRLVFPLLRRLLHRGSAHTVFQNQADRARLVSDGLVPVERTHVIPGSGVDVKKFMPAAARPGAMRSPGDGEVIVLRFLLEAAASGLPLVGTDIDGCRTVIRDGVNGLLVPPRDVESLTRAISRLVGDPDLRARMGAASRDVAVAEFEEEAILDGYE